MSDLPQLDISAGSIKDPAVRRQVERLVSFQPPYLGRLAGDPTTTAWGADMEGAFWWNLASHGYKHWNGSAVVSGL